MTAQHILQLSNMVGLSGNETSDDNAFELVLADFGFETEQLEDVLSDKIKQFWLRALPPVIVAGVQHHVEFNLHLPIEFVTEDLIWEVKLDGNVLESGIFTPIEWQLDGIYHLHDMEMQSYQISLDVALGQGDYTLVILDQGNEEPLGETRLMCVEPQVSVQGHRQQNTTTELQLNTEDAAFAGQLGDFQLKHCQTERGKLPLNTYRLREQGYTDLTTLLNTLTNESETLVLNDPLSFAQQWITIEGHEFWLQHEFDELISLIVFYCNLNHCHCFYQADDALPEEVSEYLSARNIMQK